MAADGQERYLAGAIFVRKPYRAWNETWDHDHCAFCTRKLSRSPGVRLLQTLDTLTTGYAALGRGPNGEDDYHWVCDDCFADFRQRFGWTGE